MNHPAVGRWPGRPIGPAARVALLAVLGLMTTGCSTFRGSVARESAPNPLPVPVADFETVWNTTVAVLDDYFTIANEDRSTGEIVTDPENGAGLFTPWRGDSVGFYERLESSLQSIRRFAKAKVEPGPGGGYLVRVEVFKQLEDVPKPERQAGGRAVFDIDYNVPRTREIVGPVPLPAGWIDRGRDPALEEVILKRIREALFL